MIPPPHADTTTSHFWWRPGWRPGRDYLTWHVVVADDQRAAARLALLRDALDGLPHYAGGRHGARPDRPRCRLRRAVARAGVAVPGNDDEDYRPHVTLAYATGEGPTAPAHDALSALWSGAVPLRVTHWTLLALRMAPPTYEWDVVARLPRRGGGRGAVS